jgi:exodeoxyribonuclease V alpha subunit
MVRRLLSAISINPYIITDEYYGADFTDADRMALYLGLQPTRRKGKGALLFVRAHNLNNGHCFLPEPKLINAFSQLISVPDVNEQEALQDL